MRSLLVPHPSRSAPPRGAFSLTELLVTIGIIALLAALLLPNVGKMRDAAQSTRCMSNMRQIAVAERSFAADNNNRIGVASSHVGNDPNGEFMTWVDWLIGTNGRPSYINGGSAVKGVTNSAYNIFLCPSVNPKSYYPGSSPSLYTPYGMVHAPTSTVPVLLAGYDATTWIHADGWQYLSLVPAPSKIPMFADTVAYQGAFAKSGWYYWYPHRIAENAGIHLRHNNRANVCFYDGHVAALGADDLAALDIKAAISSDYQPLTLTNPNP